MDDARKKYALSDEEAQILANLGIRNADNPLPKNDIVFPPGPLQLMEQMAAVFNADGPEAFALWVCEHRDDITKGVEMNSKVLDALVLCYRLGIERGCGACACDLGGYYYMGDLVEQDYEKAKELFEIAANLGYCQGVVNLGYIYEYGRTGEPDYQKAYECYAFVAALDQEPEAVYKLGDMYSRGKAVPKDKTKAYALWERSLKLAKIPELAAQPAFRIAEMLINPNSKKWGIELNPMRALVLFQQAEVGLRIDVNNGAFYYKDRLRGAIEGQAKARAMLDSREFD